MPICRKCGKEIEGTSSSKLFCEGHIPGRSGTVTLAYSSSTSSISDFPPKLNAIVPTSSAYNMQVNVKVIQSDSASLGSTSNYANGSSIETISGSKLLPKNDEPIVIHYQEPKKPPRICRKCGNLIEANFPNEYFCSQHSNNTSHSTATLNEALVSNSSKPSPSQSTTLVVDVPLLPKYLQKKKPLVPVSERICRRCSLKVDHPGLSKWYCRPHYLQLEQALKKPTCRKCANTVHPDSKYYCQEHYDYLVNAHPKHPAVYLWSDIHVDYPKNWDSLKSLSAKKHSKDVLILAGDVSDYLDRLEEAFSILKQKFLHVFFIPGNHELWVRKQPDTDSIQKLEMVKQVAEKCGVKMTPEKVNIPSGDDHDSVWIVPLYSWYDGSLFIEIENIDSTAEGWSDTYFCKWPPEYLESRKNPSCSEALTEYFLNLNAPALAQDYGNTPVITFSHFFSRPEQFLLINGKSPCSGPAFNFSPVSGTTKLQEQINKLKPVVHCFGHSHRRVDLEFDGCRYVNNPLGYPTERQEGFLDFNGPQKVWGTEDVGLYDRYGSNFY